ADQRRLGHQAGAEATLLHPVRWTAGVEIDFVVAKIGGNARTCSQRAWIAAADLQRQGMLRRIIAQQPGAIAMQHPARSQHFSIEPRAAGEQPMEEPAMPVGPFHHRSDTETMGSTL